MEFKHFWLKTRGEGKYGEKWDEGCVESFNQFLETIDIGDIVNISFSENLSEVVVVYVSEVIKIERKVHDANLEVITDGERTQVAIQPPEPVETPLGEQIDSGTEEADADQPTLF